MTDEENDKPSSAQASNPGTSQDVLYGWLVGRAAADLGLAQALAASEAQRAEQFKRLESSLLAQIRELQQHAVPGVQAVELHEMKAEMQSIFERMSGVEAATGKLAPAADRLTAELTALQSQWGERQSGLDAQSSGFEKVAENLAARVHDLENKLSARAQNVDRALDELTGSFKSELSALAERLGRAEISSQELHSKTVSDTEHARDFAADSIRNEFTAFKAELRERLDNQAGADAIAGRIEDAWQRRADELRRELGQNTATFGNLAAEFPKLRQRLWDLAQQVESMSVAAAPAIDFDAERARLSREIDERIGAGMREVGELRQRLQGMDDFHADREQLNSQMTTLASRMAAVERAMEQSAAGLKLELDIVKAGLQQQQSQASPAEAQLKSMEETVRTQLQEIRNYLTHEQQILQARDVQARELKVNLEGVGRRMIEIESMVHQTHALMVNETTQAAQQRDGFATELEALRGQLREAQARDALIHGIETTLNTKMQELQSQLAERVLSFDRRDAELREVKAQMQNLTRQTATAVTGMSILQPSATQPGNARTVPPEDRLRVVTAREAAVQEPPDAPREKAGLRDQLPVEGDDALRLLQARMSADIERARAELKEKSGRWKVRR